MDLLKDITRELRGGERTTDGENGSRSGGQSRPNHTSRSDSGRPDARAETSTPTAQSDEPADGGDSAARRDTHVCSFCETEFDASSSVCPDCDAEVVLRGAR